MAADQPAGGEDHEEDGNIEEDPAKKRSDDSADT
jgi:hypothetical protein